MKGVLELLRRYSRISFLKITGATMSYAQNCHVLLKDTNDDAVLSRTTALSYAQNKKGFAKGCLLLVDASGPSAQGSKGLYENTGTKLRSRFNVIGKVVDPEIFCPRGHVLIGQKNGLVQDKAISGIVDLEQNGNTELNLANTKVFIGDSTGKAVARTLSGVISISALGVVSFSGTYADTHRVVAAGISAAQHDADALIKIWDSSIKTSDVCVATLYDAAHPVTVRRVQCKAGHVNVWLSAAGGSGTRINYVVYRPVGTAGTDPSTSAAPTTATSTTEPPVTDEPTTAAPTTAAPTTAAPTTAA